MIVQTSIPGAPATASATLKFETQTENGCVLVTEAPVIGRQVAVDTATQVISWIRQNTKTLVREDMYRKQATDHGLWVITKTYTTRRCAIAMMMAESSSVEIGLSLSAEGLFVLDPGVTWGNISSGSSTDVHSGDEGSEGDVDQTSEVVVFISGIFFKRRLAGLGMKEAVMQKDQKPFVRGDDDDQLRVLTVDVEGREQEVWDLEHWDK
ncbi:hypothetical protein F5144DRAFT_579160 [Chaetomium tenue]|uniref:Uncharacterized protein n=1 Tax=Chaetomium tenue TaxID=1854479 RepID=A0ACB7P3L8_9PEZI|nr:hypothetical protein F5144DRAFT_579160 [Chaetomium globosum]